MDDVQNTQLFKELLSFLRRFQANYNLTFVEQKERR